MLVEMMPDAIEHAALIGGKLEEIVHTYKCTYFDSSLQAFYLRTAFAESK
jgi:hypothetical protein